MKKINIISCAVWLITAFCVLAGCEKIDGFGKGAPRMKFKVTTLETKGATNTTASLNTSGESFEMMAVADGDWKDNETNVAGSAGKYFDATVKYDGSDWATYDGSTKAEFLWLNDVQIHFWSYYPSSLGTGTGAAVRTITTPSAANDTLSFTYTQPAAGTSSPFQDATNQNDIIFAGNKETRTFDKKGEITTSGKDSTVNITFYHALSAIKFAVSPDDGTFATGLKIKSIKISNAAGKASCKFGLPSTFKWSGHTSFSDYSQTVNAAFTSLPTGWTSSTFSGTKTLWTLNESFFLIPQDASSVSVTVTFDQSGSEVVRTVSLGDTWEAGKYYTYKIEAKIETDISLSLSLMPWSVLEDELDMNSSVSLSSGHELSLDGASGKNAIVDDGPVMGSFLLDEPKGATWMVSVTNPEYFTVYNSVSGDPATGEVDGINEAIFYIKAKDGVDRSVLRSTKLKITLKLADGTYKSIDVELGSQDWNIVLNREIL